MKCFLKRMLLAMAALAMLGVIHHGDDRTELFATSDLREQTTLKSGEISRKLMDMGQAIRSGTITANGIPVGELSSACEVLAGRYSHTGQDVLGSGTLPGNVTISVRDGRCVITANGIPDHGFNDGSRPFRHEVSAQLYELSFPLRPTRASTPTPLSLRTNNGVLLNGAKIDMLAAACFGVGDGKIGCNDPQQPWRFDPVHQVNGFRLDSHLAHTQPDGSYHYHGVGHLPTESTVIGFAADGFPIRTPYIFEAGELRPVNSSYRLKSGPRVNPGNGVPFPGGSYDGTFRDDWEYVQGLGDLDECNGGDFGEGYAYYATERFPYYVGCFVATPDPSFNKAAGQLPQNGARPPRKRPHRHNGTHQRR